MKKSDKQYLLGALVLGIGGVILYCAGSTSTEEDLIECLEDSDMNLGLFKKGKKGVTCMPLKKKYFEEAEVKEE